MLLKLRLIQNHHDTPTAGHPGRAKILELLTRSYYWPKMYRDVDCYLKNCHTYQRVQTSRHTPYGILRLLPVPEKAWQDVSMDFVTGLLWSKGKNAILVVVCRLTKMRHLIPCRDTTTAEELAQIYIKHVACYRGLPRSIVTDWGSMHQQKYFYVQTHAPSVRAGISAVCVPCILTHGTATTSA